MVILSARYRQGGGTLIEFMIASLLGLIALGIVGSVFISGKKTAAERGKELLLLQNMTSALQQMKDDMLRAGFNGISSGSVTLSGASYAIHSQTSPDLVGFAYRVTSAGVNTYRSVVYKHKPQSGAADLLQLCEKSSPMPLTPASAAQSGYRGVCFNVFDPKQITVDSFSISTVNTASNSVSSAFSVVSMGASLLNDSNVNHTMSIEAQQRNW